MFLFWGRPAIGATLLTASDGLLASAHSASRRSASPSYRGLDAGCPSSCVDTGFEPFGWSAYPSLDRLDYCEETMFYSFSLYDNVDDPKSNHRIHACTAYGPDWTNETRTVLVVERPATETRMGPQLK